MERHCQMSGGRCLTHVPMADLKCASSRRADVWLTCLDRRDQQRRGNSKQGPTRRRNGKPGRERKDLSSIPWGWSQSHETKQVKLTQSPEQAKQDCGSEGVRVCPEGAGVARPTTPCSVGPALPDLRVFKRGQTAGFLCETM